MRALRFPCVEAAAAAFVASWSRRSGRLGRRVELLGSLDQERAEDAGEGTDDRDGIDLHHDVEDPARERDRVLDIGGNREQLSGSPKRCTAETLDLSLLLMVLEQEG